MSGCSFVQPDLGPPKLFRFIERRNCSKNAYEYVKKSDANREKKITLYEHNQLQERIVDFFLEKEADLQSCYQEYLSKNEASEYYVCIAIGLDNKSKLNYSSVSDEANKLNENLRNCLEKKLQAYDYKSLKAKHGTRFIVPLKLATRNED